MVTSDVVNGLNEVFRNAMSEPTSGEELRRLISTKVCEPLMNHTSVARAFQQWTMGKQGRYEQVPSTEQARHVVTIDLSEGLGKLALNTTALKKVLHTPGESEVEKRVLCFEASGMKETCCVHKFVAAFHFNHTDPAQSRKYYARAKGRLTMF